MGFWMEIRILLKGDIIERSRPSFKRKQHEEKESTFILATGL